ncbi:MAG: S46 family peptidase [Saprospiraceae bacterium]
MLKTTNKTHTGHFLPISLAGVGKRATYYGVQPGRTDEYLPKQPVQQIAEVVDPTRSECCDRALKIMDGYMRADLETRSITSLHYASIANGWKKWLGEMQGLGPMVHLEKKGRESLHTDSKTIPTGMSNTKTSCRNSMHITRKLHLTNMLKITTRKSFCATVN